MRRAVGSNVGGILVPCVTSTISGENTRTEFEVAELPDEFLAITVAS